MTNVISDIGSFFFIVLTAVFVENIVFVRGLGVSRLVNIVNDSSVNGMVFFSTLTLIQLVSCISAFFANYFFKKLWGNTSWYIYIHHLILVVCAIFSFLLILVALSIIRPSNMKEYVEVLPISTFNTAVLGPMLITSLQNYTLLQTVGFALGSGLGYGFALVLLSEGQRKMNSRDIPTVMRGLPINLIYLGILALAIYGLTGRRLV